jgi:hypothetical protein
MTQTQEKAADLSATDRAEQTLTRAGKQIGRLAGQATLRLRQATQAFREEADQLRGKSPTSRPRRMSRPTSSRCKEQRRWSINLDCVSVIGHQGATYPCSEL